MEECKEYIYNGMKYIVYRDGTIVGKRGIIKQRLNKDGYLTVTLGANGGRTSKRVHRVVAETFIPNPNNLPEVNHKDYNRQNPHVDNLEWVSRKENVHYSSNVGRYKNNTCGFLNGRSTYSLEEINKMRELYDNGKGIMDVIKTIFPELTYKQRKNKWNAIKDICLRKSYQNI